MSLLALAEEHGTDKAMHGYCGPYEAHLSPLRSRAFTLLEVGVLEGASLRTWAEYFPLASIIGVDINPAAAVTTCTDRIEIVTADVKAYTPDRPLDVVIDDGSHHSTDILAGLHRLWPHLSPGGWYVIEDLATQWFPHYGGDKGGSPVTEWLSLTAAGLVGDLPPGAASEVHLYPSIAFIRKASQQ